MPPDALAATERGAGERLVLVHGFTQTGRSWDAIGDLLVDRYELVAVDAPGHGDSGSVHTDLVAGAVLLGATGGRATYVGYSMGGRLCLHVALARPDLVERLVLVSATPGIVDPDERAARRAADESLAASVERDGLIIFLERWLAQPIFATLPAGAEQMQDRRRNTVAGLASSLRLAGTGTQEPLWDRLGELTMPVLLIAGALDTKFAATAERMAPLIPQASTVAVEGAGHAVHLEHPATFVEVLTHWLRT